jgi:hypothetical protein
MAELVSAEPSSTRMSPNERKFWLSLSIASAMTASPFRKMVMTETYTYTDNKCKRKESPQAFQRKEWGSKTFRQALVPPVMR